MVCPQASPPADAVPCPCRDKGKRRIVHQAVPIPESSAESRDIPTERTDICGDNCYRYLLR